MQVRRSLFPLRRLLSDILVSKFALTVHQTSKSVPRKSRVGIGGGLGGFPVLSLLLLY